VEDRFEVADSPPGAGRRWAEDRLEVADSPAGAGRRWAEDSWGVVVGCPQRC
jgi:hypothetical protein